MIDFGFHAFGIEIGTDYPQNDHTSSNSQTRQIHRTSGWLNLKHIGFADKRYFDFDFCAINIDRSTTIKDPPIIILADIDCCFALINNNLIGKQFWDFDLELLFEVNCKSIY